VITEPTAGQCSANTALIVDGRAGFACWYPQMGGYTGKAIVLPEPGGCFGVLVWHDGEFPFPGQDDGGFPPVRLHHCDADQFIRFGETVRRLLSGG
jgi:hypothetical protein